MSHVLKQAISWGRRDRRRARRRAGPASQNGVMIRPTSQQRALSQIEQTLADDHPSLGPLFDIFTGLAGQEAMPVTERITARAWRLRWPRRVSPTIATLVGLAMAAAALFTISLMLPSPQVCSGTFSAVAAPTRSVPTGSLLACAARPNKRASP
jgi:hypothetical protein